MCHHSCTSSAHRHRRSPLPALSFSTVTTGLVVQYPGGARRESSQLSNNSNAITVPPTTQGTKACLYTLWKATLCHRTRAQEWGKARGLALSANAQGMLEGDAAGETTPKIL